jgi:hypothetical protein
MSVIYDTNVTFNQPLINVKDILLLYPTDTMLDISCTRFDISGQLIYNSLVTTNSNINVNSIKLANSTNPYINIRSPLVPSYSYNITNGTNVEGSIGYVYSKLVTCPALVQNTNTNIIGNFHEGISIKGGVYMAKLDISYRNTFLLPATTQVKIQHQIHTETLNNVIYFKNSTDTHIYTNTCILFIGTGQTLTHNCYIAQFLLGISNINASIVNSQYKLSLLKIA